MLDALWKEIPGFEGKYCVSSTGAVRNRWGRIVKAQVINSGYKRVLLSGPHGRIVKLVHRAVAEVYVPNPKGFPQVNHKDTDKLNNDARNLEWVTAQGNSRHARTNGRCVDKPNARPVVGTSVKDGSQVRFPSQKDAEIAFVGKASSAVHSCLSGSRPTAYGYTWARE